MKQTKKIVCKLAVNSKKLPIDKKRQISTKQNSIINLVRNMSIFESLIVNLIFLLFPFLIYEIYIIYSNNEKEQKLFFDLAIFSSMFLIIRYSSQKNTIANLESSIYKLSLINCFFKEKNNISNYFIDCDYLLLSLNIKNTSHLWNYRIQYLFNNISLLSKEKSNRT